MKNWTFILILLLTACKADLSSSVHQIHPAQDYPIHPVPFTDVKITGGFWAPRLETNRTVTLPFDFQKCAETGRIDNFAIAGGLQKGEFMGRRYNDSDVFKVMEGAAYSLQSHPDSKLDVYLDSLITLIAAAQEKDGYLYTTRSINPDNPKDATPNRWSDLYRDHELYNAGHLYEAAVAHFQATGKRNFLNIAIKNADLIDEVFGPNKKQGVPGHQEIEIGLAKLYRITGEKKYLDLAKFFLDQRGQMASEPNSDQYNHLAYCQNHVPVIEQSEATGHAVRAGYMYAAMADVAALTGDPSYIDAIGRIWEDVISQKQYITGGVGAKHNGEAFGDDYELPNATAYNETCAAIANLMWNHRMFLLKGDGRYMDVMERVLYNGFLAGVSLDGNSFFYPNPLESDGTAELRSPWFSTACCPVNVVRFLPSVPGYAYAWRENEIFINLFLESETDVHMPNRSVNIKQKTNYPWEGNMRFEINPNQSAKFLISIRLPGWANNQPVPSDLYRYMNRTNRKLELKVNGELLFPEIQDGYAKIEREWKVGDIIELAIPMSVRKVEANEAVEADKNRISLERGPIVYCAEGVDNQGDVLNLMLTRNTQLQTEYREDLLGGINVLTGKVHHSKKDKSDFMAIPYYAWAHRGQGEMVVWFRKK